MGYVPLSTAAIRVCGSRNGAVFAKDNACDSLDFLGTRVMSGKPKGFDPGTVVSVPPRVNSSSSTSFPVT